MNYRDDHTRRFRGVATPMLCLTLLGAACFGCARTTVRDPLETNYPPDDLGAEMAFLHSMPARSAVTNDEGIHALLLVADGQDATTGYDARLALLKRREWITPDFDEPANLAMQRGRIASVIARICRIKGGVMMQLFGPVPRYAVRELVAMGFMPPESTSLESLSGLEFMGVLGRMQDYIVLNKIEIPPPPPEKPTEQTGEGVPSEAAPAEKQNEVSPPGEMPAGPQLVPPVQPDPSSARGA